MLHLMSELLGLNRGRVVLADDDEPRRAPARPPAASTRPTA
jgi:hypothetical protein